VDSVLDAGTGQVWFHLKVRAALFEGPRDIRVGELPDPVIVEPTDAIVSVLLGAVCGSDLWYYRGVTPHSLGAIGHEFMGVVERVGSAVSDLVVGDFVVAPFKFNDGTCANCRAGWTSACVNGGAFGTNGIDGGQGEAVRVPFADATLVKIPPADYPDEMMRSLVALADVMSTGHHAAVSAGVKAGGTVAVVGDGAVGLCGVIASDRLGAERVIALSRNPVRQELARSFGATDIVAERGEGAVRAMLELTDGIGVDAVLECVGTAESFATAFAIARPGASVGFVGVPHGAEVPLAQVMFPRNVGLRGGSAPVRVYLPELLEDVLAGRIDPGRVFDYETDLDGVPDAYAAMDERRAVKALIRMDRGNTGR
jgi:threonine dehydrogenase-like Zn-dependent dehydrogenase